MRLFIVHLCAAIALALAEDSARLPKCLNGDRDCLLNFGQAVVEKYYKGNDKIKINLVPIDPLHVLSLVLVRNPHSTVNIELTLNELDIIGLKNMHFINFTGFTADLSGRNEFDAMVPELDLKGKYNIDGRVLMRPIIGNGYCNIKCKNLILKYAFNLKPVNKNGNIYAALEHVKLELDPELVQFDFQNLFNGDKALGDNMNKFVNENWNAIFQEIKPSISKA